MICRFSAKHKFYLDHPSVGSAGEAVCSLDGFLRSDLRAEPFDSAFLLKVSILPNEISTVPRSMLNDFELLAVRVV